MQRRKSLDWEVLDCALDDRSFSIGTVFSEQMPSIHPTDNGKIAPCLGFKDVPSFPDIGENVKLRVRLFKRFPIADFHIPIEIMRELPFLRKLPDGFLCQI